MGRRPRMSGPISSKSWSGSSSPDTLSSSGLVGTKIPHAGCKSGDHSMLISLLSGSANRASVRVHRTGRRVANWPDSPTASIKRREGHAAGRHGGWALVALKSIRRLVVCLAAVASASAQGLAPESIANTILRVYYDPARPPTVITRGPYSWIQANDGGAYDVYSEDTPIASGGSKWWTWTRTGPNTGTYRRGESYTLLLTFTSPSAGTLRVIWDSGFSDTGSFTLTRFELTEPAQAQGLEPAAGFFAADRFDRERVVVRQLTQELEAAR